MSDCTEPGCAYCDPDGLKSERNFLIDFLEHVSDTASIDSVEAMADALLNSDWLRKHDAEVIRIVARRIYNGAGDPEQEFYDRGVAHWLEQRAIRKELGLEDPES